MYLFRLMKHSRHEMDNNIINGRISVYTGMLLVVCTHTNTQMHSDLFIS